MQLRPYQTDLIAKARQSLRDHQSVLMVAPTGAGKTALTVHMMATAASRGISSIFCVHRDTLLAQTSRALWEQKVEHGVIAAGRGMSPRIPVQVASVQTLVRRLDRVSEPGLIVIDEAHRAAAETYQKIIRAYPKSRVVGLTATPQRTDGKGLSDIFQGMVEGPTVASLIRDGYLCPYVIFGVSKPVETASLKKRMGDYVAEEIEAIMDKPSITGDAVAHYKRHANGKRCVVFCATLNHARHVCEAYNQAGVTAEHIDGNTSSAERQAILARVKSGETLVLTNVELVIEGVDVPAIEAVQWLRPTASLIIWCQGNGRGFRQAHGKDHLIILDHVQNYARHGLPDDERQWSLEGDPNRGKRKKADPDEMRIKQCEKCYAIFNPGPTECPSCGEPIQGKPRIIEVNEGYLEQLDIESIRRTQRKEQGGARTLRDLVELGKRRGLKDPAGWAAHVYAARTGAKPDFSAARGYL